MIYTVLAIREPKNGNTDYVWVDFEYTRDNNGVVLMPESKLCPAAQVSAIGLQIGDKVAL